METAELNKIPYLTRSQIAEFTERTLVTVDGMVKELEQYPDRYGAYAVIKTGGVTLVNQYALIDFLRYRKALKQGAEIPPFEVFEVRKMCGA